MEVCNKYLIDDVHLELSDIDISKSLIKDVVNSQSEFTANMIRSGAFETSTMVYFGKFSARHNYIQKMNQNYGIKNSNTKQNK